jgi:hypothetical protein
MNPETRRVFSELWFAITAFLLFFWFVSMYNKPSSFECPFSDEEFSEMRNTRTLQSISSEQCINLLERWKLSDYTVAALRRGEFDYSPMYPVFDLVCKTILDVEFLDENRECMAKFELRSLKPEVMSIIKVFNNIFPLWFECFYDRDAIACDIVIPSFSSFYNARSASTIQ